MYKKIISLLSCFVIVFSSLSINSFAKTPTKDKFVYATEDKSAVGKKDEKLLAGKSGLGKVIVIDLSKTSLENFNNIKFLREMMKKRGYIGLMNIRGDKGYNDIRNYATMAATGRADIPDDTLINFRESSKKTDQIYRVATGHKPGKINLLNINEIDMYNQKKGEYKSKLGYMADILISDGKKIAVLGNSDYYDSEGRYVKNNNFCLSAMDSKGRIYSGKIDGLNKQNYNFPYGIQTDYQKLLSETKKLYGKNDVLFVELGDTYRLDEYKDNLNTNTYKKMKFRIYKHISDYLENVFKIANKNDTIYIMSSFPSHLDFNNNRKLAPVVRFDLSGDTKGILDSHTTRRPGIIANMDIGVDILSRFGLKSEEMNGRVLKEIPQKNNIEYILNEYKRIVAVSSIRMDIINIYVTFISVSWILAALAFWQRNKISKKYRNKILVVLKELIKFGLIMPLAFLTAPIFKPDANWEIAVLIAVVSLVYYILGRKIFKDDISQICFYALAMIGLITIDSLISTPLMQSNIMSYDPMIGARYYGVGNEYEGVTIGSAILAFAILREKDKLPKWLCAVILFIIMFVSASPGMGANVGGAISESMSYLVFILLIYKVRMDLKKIAIVFTSTVGVVVLFAIADLIFGLQSHLGNFVEQIKLNGPMEILYVFGRKIAMNIQLAQTTVWVNILLIGLFILMLTLIWPNKNLSYIKKKYPIVYDGFLATIVGCVVTLLVNDSGVIAAATDSIYLLIPILIILINKGVKEKIC